jgi:hypothetical protein
MDFMFYPRVKPKQSVLVLIFPVITMYFPLPVVKPLRQLMLSLFLPAGSVWKGSRIVLIKVTPKTTPQFSWPN